MISHAILKMDAKRENKAEFDGRNATNSGRRDFIKVLVELHNLGTNISEDDMNIVLDTFYMHSELANAEVIKMLIANSYKNGEWNAAEDMTVKLIERLDETKFRKPLGKYRVWLRKMSYLPEIQKLKEQGLDNTKIGMRLGISSADVVIILSNANNPDFEDIGGDMR